MRWQSLLLCIAACGPGAGSADAGGVVAPDAAEADAPPGAPDAAPADAPIDATPPSDGPPPDAFSVTALNETDLPAEADYCVNQFPKTVTVQANSMVQMFGQIFEAGLTNVNTGPAPGILAQVGFGPPNGGITDPRTTPGWFYSPTQPNAGYDFSQNNDEFLVNAMANVPAGSVVHFVWRFSFDGGQTWTFCDNDGAGSDPMLDFDPAQSGTITVE
jgi:hypothetical protein